MQIFLPFHSLPFHFIDHFLGCAEGFQFDAGLPTYVCFGCLCLWCQIQKFTATTNYIVVSLWFLLGILWFNVCIRIFNLFLFYFYVCCKKVSSIILLHVATKFYQHPLLKRLSFPCCVFLTPLYKLN